MTKSLSITGWVVAVIAAVTVAIFAMRGATLQEDLQQLQADYVELTTQSNANGSSETPTTSEGSASEIASLEKKLEDADKEIESLTAALATAEVATKMAEATGEETAEEASEEGEESEEDSEQTRRQKAMARVQMSAMIDMAYGTFLNERAFSPEINEAVRDLLVTYGIDAQGMAQEAMQGGERIASDVKRDMDAFDDAIRNDLAGVLDAEGLDAWDEYEPYAQQYLYESLVDGQLTMLASGLNAENREMAKTIIAEELVAHLEAFEESDQVYSMVNYNIAQEDALNLSVERLAEFLEADQLAFVEGFRDLAVEQFRALAPQE